jgi:hypothetical protein
LQGKGLTGADDWHEGVRDLPGASGDEHGDLSVALLHLCCSLDYFTHLKVAPVPMQRPLFHSRQQDTVASSRILVSAYWV